MEVVQKHSNNPPGKDDRHWFDKFASVLEKNIRGVQLGIYTVAFCGLGIALRSVRPFKKFTRPNQIPDTFFVSNIKLNGRIINVEVTDKQPLLLVDHYPILGSKLRSVGPLLPLQIEGINISSNGISWLQTITRGEYVEFILLYRNSNSVSCIITMKNRNIAKHLVSLGFASVSPFNLELATLKIFTRYYSELLKAEDKAEKRGDGMWSTDRTGFTVAHKILKLIIPLFKLPFNKIQTLK